MLFREMFINEGYKANPMQLRAMRKSGTRGTGDDGTGSLKSIKGTSEYKIIYKNTVPITSKVIKQTEKGLGSRLYSADGTPFKKTEWLLDDTDGTVGARGFAMGGASWEGIDENGYKVVVQVSVSHNLQGLKSEDAGVNLNVTSWGADYNIKYGADVPPTSGDDWDDVKSLGGLIKKANKALDKLGL